MAHPQDVARHGRLPCARLLFSLLATLLLMPAVGRGGTNLGIPLDPRLGVKISLTSWYESTPVGGYAPIDVTIENRSGATRTWSMYTTSPQSYSPEAVSTAVFKFTVADREKRTFRVLAPVLTESSSPYYQSVSVSVSGYGANAASTASLPSIGYSGGKSTKFAVISSGLLPTGVTPLADELKKQSYAFAGSRVEFKDLPDDWRALAGAESIYVLAEELAGLSANQRVALQDWLTTGGELTILGVAEPPPEFRQAGFGKVEANSSRSFSVSDMAEAVKKSPGMRPSFAPGTVKRWGAYRELGEMRPNAALLSLCMLVFAAVIGPVNLFFLAGSARRARLFWTTPALSVGASAILFVIIVLQDGFGGSGLRSAIIYLQPERKKAVVLQEQIAKTGVLTSSGFVVKQSALITPIEPRDLGREQSNRYGVTAGEYTGDWFRSRSLQGQWVQAVVPTRAEITIQTSADGPPAVLSSVDAPLKQFYYHDPAGKIWTAADVRTGTRTTLAPASRLPEELGFEASQSLVDTFRRLGVPKGSFYAMTTDPKLLVPTLESIDWERSPLVLLGPVTEVRK